MLNMGLLVPFMAMAAAGALDAPLDAPTGGEAPWPRPEPKREPALYKGKPLTAGSLERVVKAEAKRARKAAKLAKEAQ